MGRDLEPAEQGPVVGPPTAHVRGQDQHLRSEPLGHLGHQLRPGDGRRVDADLVRPGPQQPVHVVDGAHSPAHGQRDEHLLGRAAHHVVGRLAVAAAGRHVEEGQLVRALVAVRLRQLHRVAGVAQVLELHALDDAAGVDVETGDDAGGETHPGRVST